SSTNSSGSSNGSNAKFSKTAHCMSKALTLTLSNNGNAQKGFERSTNVGNSSLKGRANNSNNPNKGCSIL
ncbi:MAG: hypothetical protein ACRDAI_04635, partial [Candidatus Rhabdochlamydia sp.]